MIGSAVNMWRTYIYYPFRSKAEWELALFLLHSDLTMTAIDLFLSLTHVCQFFLAVCTVANPFSRLEV